MTFGEWFREQRNLSDKTQEEVALEVGISPISLSRIENGTRCSADTIIKLCRAVNADEEEGILRAFLPNRVTPDSTVERELRRLACQVPRGKREIFIRGARNLVEAMA